MTPYMNHPANETQCDLKNKSTTDAIYAVKRNLLGGTCNGRIRRDLSKAFDMIDKIYGCIIWKELPLSFTMQIENGHVGNKLGSKHNGKISELVTKNVGVCQGSPIGADIFIALADYVRIGYLANIKKRKSILGISKSGDPPLEILIQIPT